MGNTQQRGSGRRHFHRMIESLESRRLLAVMLSDQSITGSIDTPTKVEEHTFTANAGDAVIIVVAETDTSALDPAIALLGPTGNTIATDFGTVGSDIIASLTQTGTPSTSRTTAPTARAITG
jgi:hypothetical protein